MKALGLSLIVTIAVVSVAPHVNPTTAIIASLVAALISGTVTFGLYLKTKEQHRETHQAPQD